MKKLVVNQATREIVGNGNVVPEGCIQVLAPDSFEYAPKQWIVDPDGQIAEIPGTILTEEQLTSLPAAVNDQAGRQQKIQDEINALVGASVVTMTDAQRWKLLAVVLYKLGVINASGIVQPVDKWLEV